MDVVNALSPVLAQASTGGPSLAYLIGLLIAGIAFLLVLILALRIQAFIALIMASIFVAIGSVYTPGMPEESRLSFPQIGQTIIDGMGSALGFIATIIGLGAIFGALLEHSGGAKSLARTLLKFFGEKRASWAMLVTGFIISIPVFFDVGLVIVAPLLFALSKSTKKSLLCFGLPLIAGMGVTHAFVPPTPGPVAVAQFLDVSLGHVILYGVIVGIPTAIIAGPLLGTFFANRLYIEVPKIIEEQQEAVEHDEGSLPSFGLIALIIGLPIVLILSGTLVEQSIASGLDKAAIQAQAQAAMSPDLSGQALQEAMAKEVAGIRKVELKSALSSAPFPLQFLYFLGHPVIALLVATLMALYFLGTRRGVSKDVLVELSTRALGPAGIIILITGAGGVFKQVLGASGISDALKTLFEGSGVPPLVLAYIFALLVRVAQGSATVAMMTAAGLMTGIVQGMGLSQPQLALIVIAIAAGATTLSHVNDSGFWMVSRYLGMTEKQTLKTWTVMSTVISLVGFALAWLLSLFV